MGDTIDTEQDKKEEPEYYVNTVVLYGCQEASDGYAFEKYIGYFESNDEAKEFGKGKDGYGGDCKIKQCQAFRFKNVKTGEISYLLSCKEKFILSTNSYQNKLEQILKKLTKDEKLKYIKKHYSNTFKIVNDEYIIAYKSVRADNYSWANFQYKYEIGKEYEAHCDCNSNESNSFGLSAWTLPQAIGFGMDKVKDSNHINNMKILKVHINIEDIGTIVKDSGKIRAKKLKVICEE